METNFVFGLIKFAISLGSTTPSRLGFTYVISIFLLSKYLATSKIAGCS